MRLIVEYSALALAAWLFSNLLFVIAWAKFRSAKRHSAEPGKATVIAFRPSQDGMHTDVAHADASTGEPRALPLRKTS